MQLLTNLGQGISLLTGLRPGKFHCRLIWFGCFTMVRGHSEKNFTLDGSQFKGTGDIQKLTSWFYGCIFGESGDFSAAAIRTYDSFILDVAPANTNVTLEMCGQRVMQLFLWEQERVKCMLCLFKDLGNISIDMSCLRMSM